MQCPPIYIILSVPKLWTARPTRKSYILDQIGETITMEYNAPMKYTIDGDIYTSGLQQEVTLGPPVQFLHL